MPGISPTGYHCGKCGALVDSTGVTHTDTKGSTSTPEHKAMPVALNWPEVRK